MTGMSKQTRNAMLLLGIFVFSFALYAGAESGSSATLTVLLACVTALMLLTVRFG